MRGPNRAGAGQGYSYGYAYAYAYGCHAAASATHRHQCHRHSPCHHRRPQPPATIASTSSLASNLRHRHLQPPLPPATDTAPPPSPPPPATAAASHRRQPPPPATVHAVLYVHQLCSLSAIYSYTSGNEATHRELQRVPAILGRTDSGIDSSSGLSQVVGWV